ncbi:SAM-dependent DNA methyltransferase [Enterovibrio norvegicus]|nr:SAM-dependent DNA methyltransferase [Enterovibrio norvegicus]
MNVKKIFETFRDRIEEPKYSRIVSINEIVKNDYNLNIPRYVDIFEEEKPVDLAVVTTELQEIEAGMSAIDETIRKFCSELKIEAPV